MLNLLARYSIFLLSILFSILSIACAAFMGSSWLIPMPFVGLACLGLFDLIQTKHAVRRNYPVIGNMRYLLESVRPEIRQYFFEGDHEDLPFSRADRAMVYRRARNIPANKAFGTLDNLYAGNHEFISHSIEPVHVDASMLRINIGGPACSQPYSASLLNVSAMSFGALSANAIRALCQGAKINNFAVDTGEGGISKYHLESGCDLIYEVGSGYFGCRNEDGTFSEARFKEQSRRPNVKMIELKISQGAKPGHGGMLPGSKVTPEIAEARGVMVGQDCVSPARHTAFTGPLGLIHFIGRLRELSGGKPVGFKLCIGRPVEAASLVKAMLETGIYPDFIVIDGSEGGTGAAPEEFSDNIGMPLRDGLVLMHNLLKGAGLRRKIKIGCSGKIISGFDIVRMIALGADWVNSARGFMFSLGCIQSQSCNDKCPTGIATQDPLRQRALNVDDKAPKVANFHRNTLVSVAEILGAAGLCSSEDLSAERIMRRVSDSQISSYAALYPWLHYGELIDGVSNNAYYKELWAQARSDKF